MRPDNLDPQSAEEVFEDVPSAAGQGTALVINYRPEGLGLVDRLHPLGARIDADPAEPPRE